MHLGFDTPAEATMLVVEAFSDAFRCALGRLEQFGDAASRLGRVRRVVNTRRLCFYNAVAAFGMVQADAALHMKRDNIHPDECEDWLLRNQLRYRRFGCAYTAEHANMNMQRDNAFRGVYLYRDHAIGIVDVGEGPTEDPVEEGTGPEGSLGDVFARGVHGFVGKIAGEHYYLVTEVTRGRVTRITDFCGDGRDYDAAIEENRLQCDGIVRDFRGAAMRVELKGTYRRPSAWKRGFAARLRETRASPPQYHPLKYNCQHWVAYVNTGVAKCDYYDL